MEHSLGEYLERLSTTELEIALHAYSQECDKQKYEYEMGEILRILEQRGVITNKTVMQ